MARYDPCAAARFVKNYGRKNSAAAARVRRRMARQAFTWWQCPKCDHVHRVHGAIPDNALYACLRRGCGWLGGYKDVLLQRCATTVQRVRDSFGAF